MNRCVLLSKRGASVALALVMIGVAPAASFGAESHDKVIQSSIERLKALKGSTVPERGASVAALAKVGEPAVPALLELLKSDNEIARGAAAEALANGAAEVVKSGGGTTAARLGFFKTSGPSNLSQGVDFVYGKPARLRFSEAALQSVIPALTAAINERSNSVRVPAIQALSNIAALFEPARGALIPLLGAALSEPSQEVRSASLMALRYLGPQAKAAHPALLGLLKDPDDGLRASAVYALMETGVGADAAPGLIEALGSEGGETRRAAARALGRIGPPARGALPALQQALKDKEKDVRKAAEEAIAKIEGR